MNETPLLSIGIPLYRGAEFYGNILANIDAIDYPNVEVLISDRHGLDDTADRLEARFRADNRVTIYRHDDELGWEHNYNFLLHQASGKYFRWLPQDDVLPREGLGRLIECMEEEPGTILVYHRVEYVDATGRIVMSGGHDLRQAAKRSDKWSYRDALGVVSNLYHHGAGCGIFRRDRVAEWGLAIRPVKGGLGGTRAFRYVLALRGRFRMMPDVIGYYRQSSGNFSVRTPNHVRYDWDLFRVARSFTPVGPTSVRRIWREPALLIATVVIPPLARFLWARTRQGRKVARTRLGT